MHKVQEKILEIMEVHNLSNMSLREIGELAGEKGKPQKIKHHIMRLREKGLIQVDQYNKPVRKISKGKIKNSNLVSVPIVGAANCGVATIYADQNIESYLRVSRKILEKVKKIFAIKAVGPSLNKANIKGNSVEEGDYVIIDSEDRSPVNGDYVLSVIDEVANIKKYVKDKENDRIVLLSESTEDYPPIYIHPDDNFIINGRVVQIIKKPKIN
ncbi:hypothetical protein MYX06_04620 [Patescibacteria group bacterium AH-259-L05]|nr:hypothetical protein [Patescibacteria group bacterium AH-259-L05]